jgi:hypothetical protein
MNTALNTFETSSHASSNYVSNGALGTLETQSKATSDISTAIGTVEIKSNKNVASGYASLDANAKIPSSEAYYGNSAAWGNITGTLSSQSDLNSALGTLEPSSLLSKVATSGAYSDLSGTPTLSKVATSGAYSDLSGTPVNVELQANKNVAGGYASLDAFSKVPTTESYGGAPGGSDKQVQFNNSGSFAGSSLFNWDNTNNQLSIGTPTTPSASLEVTGGPIKATGGLIIETRTSDPASPVSGQIWLRTDL